MKTCAITIGTALCALLAGTAATAQSYTNTSSVLDASGRWATGGGYSNVAAVGQAVGVVVSAGGSTYNYAGFLGTFSLSPGTDTDGDGIADEYDNDNDGDDLEDGVELAGTAFTPVRATNPNKADTDNDGVDDGAEAAAGTDPITDTMYLHITDVSHATSPDQAVITWQARGGRTYKVYGHQDLGPGWPGTALGQVTATGGAHPWYETSATYTNTLGSDTRRFYTVTTGQ